MLTPDLFPDWLAATAAARPDALALIADDVALSFAQLDQAASLMAAHLAAHHIHAGQLVPVLLPNAADAVIVVHALARLGAAIVPLNIRLTTAELGWQIAHIGGQVLLYSPATAETAAALDHALLRVEIDGWADQAQSTHSVRAPRILAPSPVQTTTDRLHAIVFTSGTSGHPKAAMLTWGNQFWSATASTFRLGVLPGDRWLCVLPLYHVGGLAILMRSALYGTAVVLHPRFDVEAITRSLHDHRVTLISLVPTMLHRLLNAGGTFPPSLRLILLGGAAADPDLIARSHAQGLPLALTYGLSEACSQVATLAPEQAIHKPGSVGKPLTFTTVSVVDDSGTPVLPGDYGEVVVSGPTVFAGYFNAPEATSRALRAGRLFTGDIGYLDDDGDLWIVQRRSDLIVTGGENVYPAEVERVLKAHPAVADALVIGLPSPEWGQQVAAAVVLKAGQALTEAALIAFARESLAGYKQPRRIIFVEALPQTASGKVQRQGAAALFPRP